MSEHEFLVKLHAEYDLPADVVEEALRDQFRGTEVFVVSVAKFEEYPAPSTG